MRLSRFLPFVFSSSAFLFSPSVVACRGVFDETRTFLETLPPRAMEKSLVAKVKIIARKIEKISVRTGDSTVENDAKIIARAKVIEALKGTRKGAVIKIRLYLHTCSREPKIAKGQIYYIAGALDGKRIFRGEWRNKDLNSK